MYVFSAGRNGCFIHFPLLKCKAAYNSATYKAVIIGMLLFCCEERKISKFLFITACLENNNGFQLI